MPLDDYSKQRYERTAQWFSDNFNAAQLGLDKSIKLEIEWHDENEEGMATLGKQLVADDDIYGETFSDWFAFQATEMGLTVDDMVRYKEGQCEEKLSEALQGNSDYVIFVPANQADVLNRYQILKAHGYDDDHIVLIMDDIANNTANSEKGNIRVSPNGPYLYHDVTIDYHPSALEPSDIKQILCDELSDRLPQVILSTADDNVFVFWSGHGEYGQLVWCDRSMGFTADLMEETAEALRAKRCYRKMGWFVETCFSASVLKCIEGTPGMIAVTAADERETSKADVYNATLKVWMSNRFTSTLTEAITANSSITIKELYHRLTTNTIGSHPRLYNQSGFGNLNITTMKEWL